MVGQDRFGRLRIEQVERGLVEHRVRIVHDVNRVDRSRAVRVGNLRAGRVDEDLQHVDVVDRIEVASEVFGDHEHRPHPVPGREVGRVVEVDPAGEHPLPVVELVRPVDRHGHRLPKEGVGGQVDGAVGVGVDEEPHDRIGLGHAPEGRAGVAGDIVAHRAHPALVFAVERHVHAFDARVAIRHEAVGLVDTRRGSIVDDPRITEHGQWRRRVHHDLQRHAAGAEGGHGLHARRSGIAVRVGWVDHLYAHRDEVAAVGQVVGRADRVRPEVEHVHPLVERPVAVEIELSGVPDGHLGKLARLLRRAFVEDRHAVAGTIRPVHHRIRSRDLRLRRVERNGDHFIRRGVGDRVGGQVVEEQRVVEPEVEDRRIVAGVVVQLRPPGIEALDLERVGRRRSGRKRRACRHYDPPVGRVDNLVIQDDPPFTPQRDRRRVHPERDVLPVVVVGHVPQQRAVVGRGREPVRPQVLDRELRGRHAGKDGAFVDQIAQLEVVADGRRRVDHRHIVAVDGQPFVTRRSPVVHRGRHPQVVRLAGHGRDSNPFVAVGVVRPEGVGRRSEPVGDQRAVHVEHLDIDVSLAGEQLRHLAEVDLEVQGAGHLGNHAEPILVAGHARMLIRVGEDRQVLHVDRLARAQERRVGAVLVRLERVGAHDEQVRVACRIDKHVRRYDLHVGVGDVREAGGVIVEARRVPEDEGFALVRVAAPVDHYEGVGRQRIRVGACVAAVGRGDDQGVGRPGIAAVDVDQQIVLAGGEPRSRNQHLDRVVPLAPHGGEHLDRGVEDHRPHRDGHSRDPVLHGDRAGDGYVDRDQIAAVGPFHHHFVGVGRRAAEDGEGVGRRHARELKGRIYQVGPEQPRIAGYLRRCRAVLRGPVGDHVIDPRPAHLQVARGHVQIGLLDATQGDVAPPTGLLNHGDEVGRGGREVVHAVEAHGYQRPGRGVAKVVHHVAGAGLVAVDHNGHAGLRYDVERVVAAQAAEQVRLDTSRSHGSLVVAPAWCYRVYGVGV